MKAFARSAAQWIRQLGRTAPPRLLFVALLSALAFGAAVPNPSVMQRVASWPGVTRGPVCGIDVSGHHAFVALGEGGLMILDLADPARPVRVGTYLPGGRTELVQVVGSRAYVGTLFHVAGGCEQEAWRTRLLILDVTEPARPKLLGSYNTILQAETLRVDGNLVYLGETGPELSAFRIIDVSDPARPRPLRVERNGAACAIWTTGERAYVVSWSTLKVLNVSDPSSPVVLTNIDMSVQGLAGASNRLYAIDSSRLSIYDVETNLAPQLLGQITVSGSPAGVHVSGSRAYVASRQVGLEVVDISNPAKPVLLSSCDTPGYATAVRTFGQYALVADTYGVQVIDLGDPAHPVLLSGYDTGLTTRGVRVIDGRAYVLSADYARSDSAVARSRLEILDVANPTRPILLGSYETPAFVRSWEIRAGLAYLACSSGAGAPGLEIVDVGYPPDPLRLSRTALTGDGDFSRLGICVTGQYVDVACAGQALQIFDVSTPAKPVRVSQTAIGDGGYAIQVVGDRAYIVSDWELQVCAVANPKLPVFLGSAGFEQGGSGGACLQVSDGYAYSGLGWQGLRITDVHTPTNPVVTGMYDTLGEVHGLWVADRRAFVAEGWKGITLFDVSDPARPAPIDRLETCGQAYGVQVSGNYAFIAEGGSGLGIASLAMGPVLITEDPGAVSAALGEPGLLTVGAYGRGSLSYQWYAGAVGDVSHPLAGATNAWFTTPAVTQTAPYWVHVSSSVGSAESRTAWVNPAPPVRVELVGRWPGYRRGSANGVQVSGNLAYFAAGDLQIWDLTSETSPRLVSTYDVEGSYVNSLTVSGNLACLCCDSQQVRLLDISQPETPTLLGTFSATNEHISSVTIVGPVAYAAGNQFRVLDVSNPSLPRELATALVSGNSVAAQGGYAYVVGDQNLAVLDVKDPAQPRLLANTRLFSGSARQVRLLGNYAYVAESSRSDGPTRYPGGLAIVDITNPSSPRLQSRTQPGGNGDAYDVAVVGTFVYLANGGLQVIDVRNPAAPVLVGTLSTNGSPEALVVSGERAYLAFYDGARVVDISAPTGPKLLQLIPTSGSVQDVACFDNYVVLADGYGGLVTLDALNPRQPVFVSAYRTNDFATRVAVNSNVAYFLGDALHIVDLSAPDRPACVGGFPNQDNGFGFTQVATSGENIILASDRVTTLDVRSSSEPKVVSVDPVETLDSTTAMAVSGPYLFLAQGWEGMHTVDLSVPAQPQRLDSYFTEAPARGIAIGRDLACLTLGVDMPGLEVVDIRDPRYPSRTASIPLPLANSVALNGSYASVTGDLLRVFDLSDPWQPVQVGSHDLGCETFRLQATGDLLYVAAADYGLAIYRLTPQLRLDPPVIDRTGMRLSWVGGPGIRLQQATSLQTPVWQDVPYSEGASSLQLPANNTSTFYRLVRP